MNWPKKSVRRKVFRVSVTDTETGARTVHFVQTHRREVAVEGALLFPGEVVALEEAPFGSLGMAGPRGMPAKDLLLLVSELEQSLSVGIPLDRSLRRAVAGMSSPRSRGAVAEVIFGLSREGKSLSAAIAETGFFPDDFIALIEASELAGNLTHILQLLRRRLEGRRRVLRRLAGGCVYPALLLGLSMVAFFVLGGWILPRTAEVFTDANYTLPVTTAWVMTVVGVVSHPFVMVGLSIGVPVVAFIAFRPWFRSVRGFRWIARIPKLGTLVGGVLLLRPLQTLGLMVSSGLPLIKACEQAARSAAHPVYRMYFQELSQGLLRGSSLEECFRNQRRSIPEGVELALVLGAVSDTGKIQEPLERLTQNLEERLNAQSEYLPKMVEPVLLSMVFGLILLVVVAAVMPGLEFLRQTLMEM